MTFLASAQTVGLRPFALVGKALRAQERRRSGDEDGARRAMGVDTQMPLASPRGTSLEHLARIALG